MKHKKLLCFGMAAALACASLQAGTAQAGGIPEGKWTAGSIQEKPQGELQQEFGTPAKGAAQGTAKGAGAGEQVTSAGWKYKALANGTVEITGYTGTGTSLSIPSKIGGKKVTSIGKRAFAYENCAVNGTIKSVKIPKTAKKIGSEAFIYCMNIKKIKIPKGVTSIGDKAFYFCEALGSVSLPETLQSVGKEAFWNTSLKKVSIPKRLTKIGERAFTLVSGCKSFKVQKGNPAYCAQDGVLFTKDKKTLVACPMGKTGSYPVPKGVRKIGNHAFAYSSLKNITCQKGLATVGKNAFSSSSVEKIVFPEGLKTIQYRAFENCIQLTSVTFPKSLKKIVENPFYSWSGSINVTLKVSRGSYAEKWAKKNKIPYTYLK